MQNKVFFSVIFLCALFAMIALYYTYLFNIFIAFLLCVATFWLKVYLQQYIKNSILASLVTVILMIALLFIPLAFVFYRAFIGFKTLDWSMLHQLFDGTKTFMQETLSTLPFVEEYLPTILNELSFSKLSSELLKISGIIGENGLRFMIDGFVITVFLFVFFCWGEQFYSYFKKIFPLNEKQINQIAHEVSGTLRIVFLSTFLNVVMQGIAFGIIVYFFNLNGILLGIIYGLCSMIPIIGGIIIWLPICGILIYQGNIQGAIIVGLYSAIFIGFIIDNIVKPWLINIVNRRILSTPLQISGFAIFFAILAGISAFGFWGIIIGPAITAFFIAILRVYENDFLTQRNTMQSNNNQSAKYFKE